MPIFPMFIFQHILNIPFCYVHMQSTLLSSPFACLSLKHYYLHCQPLQQIPSWIMLLRKRCHGRPAVKPPSPKHHHQTTVADAIAIFNNYNLGGVSACAKLHEATTDAWCVQVMHLHETRWFIMHFVGILAKTQALYCMNCLSEPPMLDHWICPLSSPIKPHVQG